MDDNDWRIFIDNAEHRYKNIKLLQICKFILKFKRIIK